MNTTYPVRSQYEDFMRHVTTTGVHKGDRTGTGTKSVFGYQMRFDLNEGFPLVTTKKVHLRSIIQELLWFLTGSQQQQLAEGTRRDHLGRMGAARWRPRPGLRRAMAQLAHAGRRPHRPDRRSHQDAEEQPRFAPHHRQRLERGRPGQDGADALPRLLPVLCGPRYRARWQGRLSCQLYQRSADIFLGVPFNIASYALLTHMVAQQCDLEVGDFIWTGGDCHIYSNHQSQVELQLSRMPFPYPALNIKRRPASIFDYEYEDFEVLDYQCHAAIKAPVAV
jgi:thymidylate synthase